MDKLYADEGFWQIPDKLDAAGLVKRVGQTAPPA